MRWMSWLLLALTGSTCATVGGPSASTPPSRWCMPGQACWPGPADWQALAKGLSGTLEQPASPLAACRADAASEACAASLKDLRNPYALQDRSGGTESLGWGGAWAAEPSAYAVAAKSSADVVAAVKFARAHRLRLVVKGTGHDYLGRSSAAGSLLVWTHAMRQVTLHDAFVAQGFATANVADPTAVPSGRPDEQRGPTRRTACGARSPIPAVTLEAGTRWLEAYQAVTVQGGRYVQGGGCTTVGAAGGFLQGGGFGSWSKKYGIAAAGLLEAEVVLADGSLVVANACQNQDLFWALRGGGGGTFGVVTRVTLLTHPLPSHFGFMFGAITAKSDAAFRALLERFLRFYAEKLSTEAWGEQVRVRGNNTLEVSLSFQGMTAEQAQQLWAPFTAWVSSQGAELTSTVQTAAIPARKMWDAEFLKQSFPSAIRPDPRPGAPGNLFWWNGDSGQVATYWWAYQSRWLPQANLTGDEAAKLAAVLFEASRHWTLELHFNKGQAGAAPEAVARDRETSMNPAVLKAAALIISAASSDGLPGVKGQEPDPAEGERARRGVSAAMALIRAATPDAGSYVNETDYFEPDWQRAFWGENYPRLLAIKRAVDPEGFFTCHHCVGSE